MNRKIASFVCLSALCGLLSRAALARFNEGTLTVDVASNGQITLTIVEGDDTTFKGTGVSNHVGGFFITATGPNNKTVSINGSLRGSGLGRTSAGTVAGKITIPYNANLLDAGGDALVYTNHYEGHFKQESFAGNWFGDVDATGKFRGNLVIADMESSIPITGNVYTNGSFKFSGAEGDAKYEASGIFRLVPPASLGKLPKGTGIVCEGAFKSVKAGVTATGEFKGRNSKGE